MEIGLSNTLLAGDPRLVEHIVGVVKSQGIFDQFRKECIADVDTKPAYQNLRTRVESSVNSFLDKQTWKPDLNKNQLRETLRKHIHEAPYLDAGVERIVDQVVNPKVYSVFMPQIEDVVYKFLGIERPRAQEKIEKIEKNEKTNGLKDLLPKDLDPISPESDRNSLKDVFLESDGLNAEIFNGNDEKSKSTEELTKVLEDVETGAENETIENGQDSKDDKLIGLLDKSPDKMAKYNHNTSFKSDDTNKTEEEEEESPMFEPIDIMNLNESNMSNDSHLSGISELTSHRSRSPDFVNDFGRDNFDFSNADSHLSKVSSNSRLSIVTDFESSNHASTPIPSAKDDKSDSKQIKDHFKAFREVENGKNRDIKFSYETKDSRSKSNLSSKENSRDANDSGSRDKEDKSKSSRDKSNLKNHKDKDAKRKSNHGTSRSDKHLKSKNKDKNDEVKESLEKFRDGSNKKDDKPHGTEKKEVKDLKDMYKEKIRELREKKELTEKEKLGKETGKSSKSNKDKRESSTSKDRKDHKKDYKSSSSKNGSSTSRDRSKGTEPRSDSRDKSKRDDKRYSKDGKNEKSEKSDKINSKPKKENKSDFRSRSIERHDKSDKSSKDKKRRDDKKKSKDDHSSLRKSSNDRRSTDRDGSNGSSSKSSQKSSSYNSSSSKLNSSSSFTKDNGKENNSSRDTSDGIQDSLQLSDGRIPTTDSNTEDSHERKVVLNTGEMNLPLKKRPLPHDESEPTTEVKIKKPKIAKNLNEARKLAKIRKQVEKKEKKVTEKHISDKRSDSKNKLKLEKENVNSEMEDLTSVPDEERVQIIEIPYEDYDEPYPDNQMTLSLEETSRIILEDTSCFDDFTQKRIHSRSTLSEMERSIRQSLSEMMSDHKLMMANADPQNVIHTLHSESSTIPSTNNKPETCENISLKPQEVLETSGVAQESLTVEVSNLSTKKRSEEVELGNSSNDKFNLVIDKSDSKDVESKEKIVLGFTEIINVEQVICTNENIDVCGKELENKNCMEQEANFQTIGQEHDHDPCLQSTSQKTEEKSSQNCNSEIAIEKIEESVLNIHNEIMATNDNVISENEKENTKVDNNNMMKDENEKENQVGNNIKFRSDDSKIHIETVPVNYLNTNKDENDLSTIELKELLPKEGSSLNNQEVLDNTDEQNEPMEYIALMDKAEKVKEDSSEESTQTELDIGHKENIMFCESGPKPEDKIRSAISDEVDVNNEEKIKFKTENNIGVEFDIRTEKNVMSKVENNVEEVENSEQLSSETESEFELKLEDDCPTPVEELTEVYQEVEKASKKITDSEKNDIVLETEASAKETIEMEEKLSVIEISNSNITAETSKDNESSQFGSDCNVKSPIEEDCLYLDADDEQSLKFTKFIQSIEIESENSTLEQMIESLGGQIAKSVTKDKVPFGTSRKRHLSPLNILVNNANNNKEMIEQDDASATPENNPYPVEKKQKFSQYKKEEGNASICNSRVQNGENFIMQLSPDSVISTSNEKSVGNTSSKEEKSRQRSSQRYSSDDLYKPRPLFSYSSRRNRRSHQ